MKNILKVFSFIFILLLVGCGKDKKITCNIDISNNIENYNMKGTYKIYYKNNYVTRIEKEEQYISSSESVINYFDESKRLEYYNLNDLYGGVIYDINADKTKVDISVLMDMNLVNVKEMVKNKYLDKDYVVGNNLTTSGIVKIYESKGAVCDI